MNNTDNTPKTNSTITCPKCFKAFQNANALRMHNIRVHTLAGRRGALKGARNAARVRFPQNPEMTHAERSREYNKRLRQANIRKGLTGAGKPRKIPYRPRRHPVKPLRRYPSDNPGYKRQLYIEARDRFHAMGLDAKGKPFKSAKGMAIAQAHRANEKHTKRIQYVYPLPNHTPAEAEPQTATETPVMHFCPGCGENLDKWRKE